MVTFSAKFVPHWSSCAKYIYFIKVAIYHCIPVHFVNMYLDDFIVKKQKALEKVENFSLCEIGVERMCIEVKKVGPIYSIKTDVGAFWYPSCNVLSLNAAIQND